MKAIDIPAAVLVLVGALNWGLVGAAKFNLVAALLGQTILASIVYSLVGLAAGRSRYADAAQQQCEEDDRSDDAGDRASLDAPALRRDAEDRHRRTQLRDQHAERRGPCWISQSFAA